LERELKEGEKIKRKEERRNSGVETGRNGK